MPSLSSALVRSFGALQQLTSASGRFAEREDSCERKFSSDAMNLNEAKKLSNAFSTGGGGVTFESRVQSAFVALMLSQGACPCLAYRWPIVEVGLQTKHRGYDTDDALVAVRNDDTGDQCRLLVQIKHSISFTKKDSQMPDVIGGAWRDFNKGTHFDPTRDAIALVTGPISRADTENVCRLLELARGARDATDFDQKIRQSKAVSESQREKLDVVRHHITNANGGSSPKKEELWKFLKCFHLIGFDMDLIAGVALSLVQSVIGSNSPDDVELVWGRILQEVQQKNSVSGVLTWDSVSQPLKDCFKRAAIRPVVTIAPSPVKETLALNLIGGWDEKSQGDREVIESLSRMAFSDWQAKVREIWKQQG